MVLTYFTKREIHMIQKRSERGGACPRLLLQKPHAPSAAAGSRALYGWGCLVQGHGSSLEIAPASDWPMSGYKGLAPFHQFRTSVKSHPIFRAPSA